jgi:tetratricopeptide (TPR) repeat protein
MMLGLALGLMAKPMVVTLPCTLLLLDYWPLGRWRRAQNIVPLAREKLPLFALVAVVSVVTWRVQSSAGAVLPMPLANRLGHALVTYVAYLWKMLWPVDLAAMYPHPGVEAPLVVLLATLLLALLTAVAIVERRRRPFLLVGWLWYLGTLVPVIGLVQVGAVAMADRFTYVPLVGVFVAVAWLVPPTPAPRVVAAAAGVVLALLAARAWTQVYVWRDSATLFANALAVDEANPLAHVNLAVALDARGDLDGATAHLERALVLRPGMVTAHVSLGNNLARKGRYEEAIVQYRAAIAADPGSARALNNLGWVQLRLGRLDEAIDSLERALRIEPGLATAENDLGMALARRGDNAAALSHFERAVAADPRYAEAHNNLAAILLSEGRLDEGIAHAERAIAAQPAFAEAHANRIVGLVRLGRYRDAWAAVRAARAARVNLPDWLVSALAERMPDPGA